MENNRAVLKEVPLLWTSFAEAGQTGSRFLVWLPSKAQLRRVPQMPFLYAKESYSRPGNVDGSIADGDRSTYRTTYDGRMQLEDWFAVQRERPVAINAVVFAHGQVSHDGGWWDTAKGKPRIQILATPDGSWEDVGVLETLSPDRRHDASANPRRQIIRRAISGHPGGRHSHRRRAGLRRQSPAEFCQLRRAARLQPRGGTDPADILP